MCKFGVIMYPDERLVQRYITKQPKNNLSNNEKAKSLTKMYTFVSFSVAAHSLANMTHQRWMAESSPLSYYILTLGRLCSCQNMLISAASYSWWCRLSRNLSTGQLY